MNPPTDICSWLASLDLGDLAPLFEANHISLDALHALTNEDLRDLGITSLGHRKQLLAAAAAALNAPEIPAELATPPPEPTPQATAEPMSATPGPQLVPLKHAAYPLSGAAAGAPSAGPARPQQPGAAESTPGRKAFSSRFMAISIGVHVILGLGACFWVVQNIEGKRKLQFANGPPSTNPSKRALEHRVSLQNKKNAGGAPAQAQRIAVTGLAAKITLPDLPSVPTTSTQFVAGRMAGMGGAGFGTGLGFGNGSGMGVGGMGGGSGKLFGLIPQAMGKRCAKADRLQRLKDNGGTPACEDAVVKGLRWFKTNQNSDGSWGDKNQVAMTGLALMAYFGHCETPVSAEFGATCVKGITYLVDVGMRNDGKFGNNQGEQPFCYEHAIGTYALAEATTFCKEIKFKVPNLVEITTKAGQFIIDNQHEKGGWAYSYAKTGDNADVSVVGWQIQALKACSHTGIEFRDMGDCINRGLDYLATCQNASGAFGYKSPPPVDTTHQPLTGVGMLCYQMWGRGKGAIVRKAAKYTLDTTTFDFKKGANLYAHYYESQAMMQRGTVEWKKYNDLFRDQLLNNQESNGSWGIPPGAPHIDNTIFSTCLCTLMLEVYYRFLSTGGTGGTGGRDRFGY